MKRNLKIVLTGLVLAVSSVPALAEAPSIKSMHIKLSNLEIDISKEKLKLFEREEKLDEMKLRALQAEKVDQKAINLKLAEVETALAKDKLLLSKREVKLHEMRVALLKVEK